MNNNFDYYFNSKIAEIGSDVCQNYLTTRKNVSDVIDLQQSEYGKINNVDFSYVKDGKIELAEVKCDRIWYSGNLCFETISNDSKKTPGCFLATKSSIWLHVFPHTKKAFLLKTPEVRIWFLKNEYQFREVKCNTTINNKYAYTTVSKLVPIVDVFKYVSEFSRKINIPEKWMPYWTKDFLIQMDNEMEKNAKEKKIIVNRKWENFWIDESSENKECNPS